MKMILHTFGVLLLSVGVACAADTLIVHEWGTLTSLEDENGEPIAGINADDEPVPSFVHQIMPGLLLPPTMVGSKGVPRIHPDVTMRLETPVIYIHAPPGFAEPVDVKVMFRGGWLTEFYPDAQAEAPGIDPKISYVGHINAKTEGTLHWAGLKVGGDAAGPATSERVWLAPRNVAADTIHTQSGESEKFLFYRGVGCQRPFLTIVHNDKTGTFEWGGAWATLTDPPPFWLADIRADGSVAYKKVAPWKSSPPFDEKDYSPANLVSLRAALEAELVGAGLYKDEAEALLSTWAESYFKSPGLRAFYLWPPTLFSDSLDQVLPLTVSPKAVIKRVMLGRIELVTPAQRAVMAKIGTAESSEALRLYTSLGRFRDALLLNEERRAPTPGLKQFIQQMGVAYYQP